MAATARFWHETDCRLPLDRNQRWKIYRRAEGLEARKRNLGCRNGVISVAGMTVLHVLLFTFLGRTGRCDPSYESTGRAARLSRQGVRNALKRLEAAGVIRVMRRLVRKVVSRERTYTGRWQSFETTVQHTNAYLLDRPSAGASVLQPPTKPPPTFPKRQPGGLLQLMDALTTSRRL